MDSTLATKWGNSIFSFIDAKTKSWEFRTTTLIHASRLLKHWTIKINWLSIQKKKTLTKGFIEEDQQTDLDLR